MKLLNLFLLLFLLNTSLFAAKTLNEKNISKTLDSVNIAKEHKNLKAMSKHYLSHTTVSLTDQDIESVKTERFTFNEYKRYLSKKWKSVQSNKIEVKERNFAIEPDGKSALVNTTLVQTVEIDGVKIASTVYETIAVKLYKGKVYINYYSSRTMLNTSLRVN